MATKEPEAVRTAAVAQLQEQLLSQYADITKDLCKELGLELRELVARPRSAHSKKRRQSTEQEETRRTEKLIRVAQHAVLRNPGLADVAQSLSIVSAPNQQLAPWPLSTESSASFHIYRTPLDKFRQSLNKEKAKFEKESQAYRLFQENLERERKLLQEKLEAKEVRALRQAQEQRRLLEEMQTKRSLLNQKRLEVRHKHEVLMKSHFEHMRKLEHTMNGRPKSSETKARTSSNSPRRPKTEADDERQAEELLRTINEKLLNGSMRSIDMKTSYKEKIKKHLAKVNQTLATTQELQESHSRILLLRAAQKRDKLVHHRTSKESLIHTQAEKKKNALEEKWTKVLQQRAQLERRERQQLHLVDQRCQERLLSATASSDLLQKETLRRKAQKAQTRKLGQLENYTKQRQILEMKKNHVRDKEKHASAIVSLMNYQKEELVETKIRDQLELKRQREESKDRCMKA